MALASSFVPGEVCVSMNTASQGNTPSIVNNLLLYPDSFQMAVSTLSAPRVVCLPSLQEQCNALPALSQPSLLTFKTPGFKPY